MGLAGTEHYPAATRRLRLGIVGGGRGLVGQWHWTGVRLSNRWDLVAGALSSDPDVAQKTGRAWLLPEDRVYSDYRAMAKAEAARADGVEAVAICTPNWTHRPIAEAFMAEGIDIICDKPIANTLEDCDALAAAQAKAGVIFAVTHPYAYHPMIVQARAMVAAGAIGRVTQVLVEYAQDWATAPASTAGAGFEWRQDPAKVGRASATADIGTHALHLLETVAGTPVTRLRADFHTVGKAATMEDTAFLSLRLANGAPGTMWITQAAPGNFCGLRLRTYGETGGLEWDQEYPEQLRHAPLDAPWQILHRGHGAGIVPEAERMVTLPRGHGEALSDAWGNLYTEIALAVAARRDGQALAEGLIDLPGLDDGARGVRFVHAAADSHEADGAWVDLA